VIGVDANILIYAHRSDSDWHLQAKGCVKSLAESKSPWAIPWPCIHEFIGIATHPRIYDPPTALEDAFHHIDIWRQSPSLVMIGETQAHFEELINMALQSKSVGPRVHDAKIAAICIQHGVSELWTADRDFQRFPSLKTRNPLIS
jgi:uncharacterized protein